MVCENPRQKSGGGNKKFTIRAIIYHLKTFLMLKNKNIYLLSMASLWSVGALAQSSLLPAKPEATNYVELLMMSIAILLVVVIDRKSTRLNSSHSGGSRMPSSA